MGKTPDDIGRILPKYRFDLSSVADGDWLGMCDNRKFPGKPARQTVYKWVHTGARMPGFPRNLRLKLPTFLRSGRRYTTLEAYHWWMDQQQEDT